MSKDKKTLATRIEEEHASLHSMTQKIRTEFAKEIAPAAFADWKIEILVLLRDFQNELLKHFDLEELSGFMEDLLMLAPRKSRVVEQLEAEHEQVIEGLQEALDDLKKLGEFKAEDLSDFRTRVEKILTTLDAHEAAERELIYDVYFQDIGIGD